MKPNVLLYVLMSGLVGCAVTSGPTVRELTSVQQIVSGMSQSEVERLMGSQLTIGYEKKAPVSEFQPITIAQPYRKEKLPGVGEAWDVSFYVTEIKQPDGKVTDDELMPFVFQNNRLVGRGWAFLAQTKQKLQKAP